MLAQSQRDLTAEQVSVIHESCMMGNLHAFCRLLIFFSKSMFLKISCRNTIRVSNSVDSDQARHYVGPDLVNTLFAKVISRHR